MSKIMINPKIKFRRNLLKIILAAVPVILTGCQSVPDFEAIRMEILNEHEKFIDAHLNKDVAYFTRNMAEDYVFVANGDIRKQTEGEIRSNFTGYLNNTTFTEYRDLQEPVIGFSKDGSIAWSIVKVKVAGKRKMDDGAEREFDVTYAWITLYEWRSDEWIRLTEVSTHKE